MKIVRNKHSVLVLNDCKLLLLLPFGAMSRFVCGRCTLPIGGMERHIRCDGCRKTEYHLSCTKLNVYDLHRCTDNDNLLWMCDHCLYSFRKQFSAPKCDETNKPSDDVRRNEKDDEIDNQEVMESSMRSLQLEVAEIKQSLSDLKHSINSSQMYDIMQHSSTPQEAGGSRRTVSLNQNDMSPLLKGSSIQPTSVKDKRKFWIFFTRVAKHVSVDAMKEMVSNSLHLNEPPDVVKIMPRWSTYDELRYVSFKVGVDCSIKEMALKESTWPSGLLFREFIRRESYYWEP